MAIPLPGRSPHSPGGRWSDASNGMTRNNGGVNDIKDWISRVAFLVAFFFIYFFLLEGVGVGVREREG